MSLNRVDVKLPITNPEDSDHAAYTRILTRWLKADESRWMDIADYAHVPSGPIVMIVGADAQFSVDAAKGELGVLYSHRGELDGDDAARVASVLRTTLQLIDDLEREDDCPIRIRTDRVDVAVNDRAAYPNDADTAAAFVETVGAAVTAVFGSAAESVEHVGDPDQRLTVRVTLASNVPAGQLLADAAVTV
ncbi:MAG: hypothetical protein ABGY41_22945 [Candidatus Poribacteria bacterium]